MTRRNDCTRTIRAVLSAAVVVFTVAASAQSNAPQPKPRDFALQAESPDFWKLVDRGTKLTTVATGFGFTEGPVWDDAGFLYVSDETINKIYKL